MKYNVSWAKTYVSSGEEIIEADSRQDAVDKMNKMIGDLEGSMQYIAEEDYIDVVENYKMRKHNES